MQRRYRERVSAESATVPAAAGHAAVSGVTPPATAPTATAPTATAPTATAPTAASSPPLMMRIRPAHWATVDYVVATLCAVIIYRVLFGGIYVYRLPVTVWHARDWIPPLLAVCLSVPVAIRRGRPLLALILVLAACVAAMGLGGLLTRAAFLPLAIVLYLVAATRPRRVALAGLAGSLLLMALQAMALHMSGDGSGNAVAASLVLIMCWMAGLAVQQRRAYTARLREQVAGAAVTEERLRIARELHDVVAHSMTVVAVQAGFGEYVFDRQPAEARAALAAIQTVTREALADMQRLLGVLRQAQQPGPGAPEPGRPPPARERGVTAAPLAPAPGLADLERLVSSTAGAGVQVEVRRTGQVRSIPAGVDLSAFRIVQEALTNVVRHSGADTCRVSIDYGDRNLSVEITDPGPASVGGVVPGPGSRSARGCLAPGPGTGHGIAGMRERVSLCGGDFAAGPLPGRGYRVAAHLPLPGRAP